MDSEYKSVRCYKAPMIVHTHWDRVIFRELDKLPPVAAVSDYDDMIRATTDLKVREYSKPIREYPWHDIDGKEYVVYLAFFDEEDYDVFNRVCEVNHQNKREIIKLRDEVSHYNHQVYDLSNKNYLLQSEINRYEDKFKTLQSFWARLKFLFRGKV